MTTYSLTTQPWLLVRTLQGTTEEVSLVDAVVRSRQLQGLVGEVPSQVFALYRLLLAILHRAVPWDRIDPRRQWAAAWHGDLDLAAPVIEHLERYADRFDLLHPTTPFYQVADLRTGSGGVSALTTLVADVPNNHQYFTTRAGRSLDRISLAEAARWLVHAHAFDPSGIKSGALGDPRVKGGKGYPIGTSWSGQLGGLVVEGGDLLETLLLNLVLLDRDGVAWSSEDSAVWERPPQTATVEGEDRIPAGLADLLTWQSRRVRLSVDDHEVTGVLVANGDPLRPQNRHALETMTGWRRSAAQEKALREPLVYMPRTHLPARAVWRGLPALLPQVDATVERGGAEEAVAPGVLRWLADLEDRGHLPEDTAIRTRAIGIQYGSQSSVIDEVVDDALLMHAVLLGEAGAPLRRTAIDAVHDADTAARALGQLASNLMAAAGGSDEDVRRQASQRAQEQVYFALDAPYRRWLASLTAGVDGIERRELWQRHVRRVVAGLGRELVEDASTPAWKGRPVMGRHVDAALAEIWFDAALRKALVLVAAPDSGETHERPNEERSA